MHSFAIGKLQNPLNCVFPFVDNDMVCAVLARNRRLLLRTRCTDDGCPTSFTQLREDETCNTELYNMYRLKLK